MPSERRRAAIEISFLTSTLCASCVDPGWSDAVYLLEPATSLAVRACSVVAERIGPFPSGELYPNLIIWGRPGEGWFDLINGRSAPIRRPDIEPWPPKLPSPSGDLGL